MNLLALLVGAAVGFLVARRLRRPDRAAQAASVARNVSGTLGRRRGLTPPELQRACFSEMVRHVRVDARGRTHAPGSYEIRLHPDDLAVVEESRRWFVDGLTAALHDAARSHGWTVDGPVSVDCTAYASRRPGVPGALAITDQGQTAPAPPPARPSAASSPSGRALVVVRSDTGDRIPLTAEALTIGRSRDRDITIDDNRVSRSHARIEPAAGGWTLVDEGSSNGTRLGGRDLTPHTPRPLRSGDVVGIGPVDLRVTTGPNPVAPGTRALDDGDRTRISAEVLPKSPERPR